MEKKKLKNVKKKQTDSMAERPPTKQMNGKKNNFWIRLFVLLEVSWVQ